MNKLFTKIAALCLGATMAVGVGVAVASNSKTAEPVSAATTYVAKTSLSAGDVIYMTYTANSHTWELTSVTSGTKGNVESTTGSALKGTYPLTVEVTGSNYYFRDSNSKYIAYTGTATSSNNKLWLVSDKNSNGTAWTVSFNDSAATIKNVYNTSRYLKGNNQSGSERICGYTTSGTLTLYEVSGPTKLTTPSPSYNDANQTVIWSAITGASSYQVKVDSGSYAAGTSPYDVSGLATGVSHTIYVIAKGDGTNYTDSDAGSTSFTPTTPTTIQSVSIIGGSAVVSSATIGDTDNLSASATNATGSGVSTFTWNSSNTSVATVDSNGVIKYLGNGSTNITATSNYPAASGGSNVGTLGITVSNLKGSSTNPYSVSEAKAIADTLSRGTNNGLSVHCIGKVSAVGGSVSSKATSPVTFTIQDLTDSTKTLTAFSIQNGSTTDPSATNYVAVDYEVLIYGYIIDYNGTKEIGFVSGDLSSSGFVYSHAPAVPVISALALDTTNVTTQFDLNSEFSYSGLVVTGTVDDVPGVVIPSGDYSVSTPDMTSEGVKTVTVTYTGSDYDHQGTISSTYNINVVIPSPDETIDLIDDIGTVTYTQSSYNKILAARNAYNALPTASQALVTNYSTLTDAESDFDDLELAAVKNVENLIDDIGTVTLSSESDIVVAEAAYAALLDGNLGKSLVNNYSTLTTARATYNQLVQDRADADDVEALIVALPTPSSITDYSYHSQIVEARTAYNALNSSAKGMVSNYQKLVDCETADAQYAPTVVGTYSKVTDLSQLSDGATVIITNGDGTVAMGSQSTNNRSTATGAASADANISISSDSTDIQVFTIESYSTQSDTIVAFKTLNALDDVSGYIYAASSGSNHLKTQSSVDANAKFYVTLSSGNFTVSADGSSNRHIMRYNSASSLFSCYASGQQAVALYVKGSPTPVSGHDVTFNENAGGDIVTNMPSTLTGQSGTVSLEGLNEPIRSGYTFQGWSLSSSGEIVTEVTVSDSDVEVFAIWAVAPTPTATAKRCYSLVTSTDGLVAGAKYIIASSTDLSDHAMSTTQNSNNRAQEDITINGTVAPISSDGVQVVTLEGSAGAWNFAVSGGYLYAASSSANHLKTESSVDGNGNANWAITFSGSVASIVAQGNNSRNVMQFNASSSLFACYASASQTDVSLYRLDFEETLLGNVSCTTGSPTFPDGYTWNTDLQGVYNDLPTSEKTSLATKSAAVGSGLERYDYIVKKYNPTGETDPSKTNYIHFISGRSIDGSSRALITTVFGDNNPNTMAIVVIVSVVSVSAIGGYFFLRKRKEN